MISQISFIISKEYEKKLFAFITNECECNILLTESSTGDFIFGNDCEITSDKYLISPLPADFKFRIEKRQSNYSLSEVYVIYPFDQNNDFLPIIEYERDLFSEKTDTPCRLCMRTSSISPQFKKGMKQLFHKIKKWIKVNSLKKITVSGLGFYEVI